MRWKNWEMCPHARGFSIASLRRISPWGRGARADAHYEVRFWQRTLLMIISGLPSRPVIWRWQRSRAVIQDVRWRFSTRPGRGEREHSRRCLACGLPPSSCRQQWNWSIQTRCKPDAIASMKFSRNVPIPSITWSDLPTWPGRVRAQSPAMSTVSMETSIKPRNDSSIRSWRC